MKKFFTIIVSAMLLFSSCSCNKTYSNQSNTSSKLNEYYSNIDQYKESYFKNIYEMENLVKEIKHINDENPLIGSLEMYTIKKSDDGIYFDSNYSSTKISDDNFYTAYNSYVNSLNSNSDNIIVQILNSSSGINIIFYHDICMIENAPLRFFILYCENEDNNENTSSYYKYRDNWYYKFDYFNI